MIFMDKESFFYPPYQEIISSQPDEIKKDVDVFHILFPLSLLFGI